MNQFIDVNLRLLINQYTRRNHLILLAYETFWVDGDVRERDANPVGVGDRSRLDQRSSGFRGQPAALPHEFHSAIGRKQVQYERVQQSVLVAALLLHVQVAHHYSHQQRVHCGHHWFAPRALRRQAFIKVTSIYSTYLMYPYFDKTYVWVMNLWY